MVVNKMVHISDINDDVTLKVYRNLSPDVWEMLPLINKRSKDLFFNSIRLRVVSMKNRVIRVFGPRKFGDLAPFDIFYINTTRNIYRRQMKERYRALNLLKSGTKVFKN